jgi:hypothetical protein
MGLSGILNAFVKYSVIGGVIFINPGHPSAKNSKVFSAGVIDHFCIQPSTYPFHP